MGSLLNPIQSIKKTEAWKIFGSKHRFKRPNQELVNKQFTSCQKILLQN